MTTTVIDLSSDDEETTHTNKNVSPTNTFLDTHSTPTRNQIKKQRSESQTYQQQITTKTIDDFIDHVVVIWLHRVQTVYKNLHIPNNILKSKANEAAKVLGVQDSFSINEWFARFNLKMKNVLEKVKDSCLKQLNIIVIEEIIKAEKPTFFGIDKLPNKSIPAPTVDQISSSELKKICDDPKDQLSNILKEQKKHLEQIKKAQIDRLKAQNSMNLKVLNQEPMKSNTFRNTLTDALVKDRTEEVTIVLEPDDSDKQEFRQVPSPVRVNQPASDVISVEDVLKDPIQTYEEALDCMGLVENYLLSVRNLNAVVFAHKIECFLRNHISS